MQQRGRGPLAITDEQVIEETRRSSEDWYVMLDAWGARERSHAEIAEHLRTIYGLDDNWSNTLAVRYAHARDLDQATSVPGDLIAAMILKPAARARFEALSNAEQRALIERLAQSADSAERRMQIQELVATLNSGDDLVDDDW